MATRTSLSILVLGAGELGLPIIRSLAARARAISKTQIDITVLIRSQTLLSTDPSKQAELDYLRSLGCALVSGDVIKNTAEELTRIFTPFHTVIGCTGFSSGDTRGTQLKIARSVLAARVNRYLPWMFGADYPIIGRGAGQDLFDEQLDVQALLAEQNHTAWIVIPVGVFMSFLFSNFWGVLEIPPPALETDVVCRALGSWDTKITATTPENIGRCVSQLLCPDEQPVLIELAHGVTVKLAGDTRTYAEIADIVDTILQRKVKRELWDIQKLTAESKKDPTDSLAKYRLVFAKGQGVAWNLTETFNKQNGLKTTSIGEYLGDILLGR